MNCTNLTPAISIFSSESSEPTTVQATASVLLFHT